MKYSIFISLCIAVFTWSCEKGVLTDKYHDLPESGWKYDTEIIDSFTVVNDDFYHQIFANIRISSDYEFSNINLKLQVTDPDNLITEHKVTLELAEKSGKWKGSGLGDVITYQLPILNRKFLDKKGKYTFKTSQNMRINPLSNVLSAGIKVQQQEEIF